MGIDGQSIARWEKLVAEKACFQAILAQNNIIFVANN
jgi:hypothetical protein